MNPQFNPFEQPINPELSRQRKEQITDKTFIPKEKPPQDHTKDYENSEQEVVTGIKQIKQIVSKPIDTDPIFDQPIKKKEEDNTYHA
mgnify:CR=1 FL=1